MAVLSVYLGSFFHIHIYIKCAGSWELTVVSIIIVTWSLRQGTVTLSSREVSPVLTFGGKAEVEKLGDALSSTSNVGKKAKSTEYLSRVSHKLTQDLFKTYFHHVL